MLDPGVRVDVAELFTERRRAAALAASEPSLAAAIARGAIALYRGDLLPDDPFEDWVEPHRIDARDAMLDLLALCVAEAAERGDLDDVRRLVQRGIELAPYDDTLTRQVASLLIERGRRGEARSVLLRARAALAEIGLEPPATLARSRALPRVAGRRTAARKRTDQRLCSVCCPCNGGASGSEGSAERGGRHARSSPPATFIHRVATLSRAHSRAARPAHRDRVAGARRRAQLCGTPASSAGYLTSRIPRSRSAASRPACPSTLRPTPCTSETGPTTT